MNPIKYVFVGDIHGKVQAVEEALAKEGKKIFVGDFIDSWDRSPSDHRKCYDLVFDAIEKGEAEAVFGNHELSYLMPHHRCSGWDSQRNLVMRQVAEKLHALWKPYLLLAPDFLVSHAGLSRGLWKGSQYWGRGHSGDLKDLKETLDYWWPDTYSPMHWIGHSRGGNKSNGGLFWCDFRDEFKPIDGLRQVFGHTRGDGIRYKEAKGGVRSYCVDCLDGLSKFAGNNKDYFLELEV